MYCRKCSNSIPDSSLTCPVCGLKIAPGDSVTGNTLSQDNNNLVDTKLSKVIAIIFAVVSSLTMLLFILLPQSAIKKIDEQKSYDMFNLFKATTLDYNLYKLSGDYDNLITAIENGTLSENTSSTDKNYEFYKNYSFHDKIMDYTTMNAPAYFEKFIAVSVISLLIIGIYSIYKVLISFKHSFVAQNVSAYTNIFIAILLLMVSCVIKWDYYLASDTILASSYITLSPIILFYLILGSVQKFIISLQMHKHGIVLSTRIGDTATE